MKTGKYLGPHIHGLCYTLIILTFILVGFGIAQAQENLAQEAYAIFQQNCLGCHGEHGAFTEDLVIDRAALIASGTIVPRNPNASEFLDRLIEDTPEKPRMPWGQPALSVDAIQTIRLWIQAGAPDWEVQYDINFITTDAMLDTIQAHLEGLSAFDRPSARYFTLTHLYNAGESPEALDAYKIALSKLVNSLSWGFDVINPQPIDLQETIFYIDLRHYEWDVRNEAWTQIEREYPYSIDFDPETQAGLHEKLTHLRTEMACEVPFIHVDWFLANASLPPLYHDILDLPETDRELEQQLEVNVTRNIDSAPGFRVWRAGFNDSGVSNNNRVVERHTSRYGAYWKSYDFAGSVGPQNIFTHPLTFRHDGGEVVFNLPNGLQGYYISDASGNRIDEAPTTIVSNPAASNPAVRNGLSCIGCHTEGMKTFEDEVRAVIMKSPAGPVKDQGLRLYVEQSVMDDLVAEDTERYRAALEKTGGVFGGIEPVHRFYEEFQGPVDASHAAAAVGLETEAFLEKIRENPSLQRLGLSALESENGDVKRDAWTSNFTEVISALNSPDDITTQPVEPVPDLRPGDLVSIPDPNLRTVIEELLGKAAGSPITAEEMSRLTRIDADDAGISNLIGLEAATKLERIEFRNNSISDLTPLAGLTRLNNIKLQGNRITNVSPLAGLVNVDWLGLEENEITNLSPLKGLIKLNGIGISGNPISDVSPLASLISLERINAWNTPISDFSTLAGARRLRWIEFGNNNFVSALPSLKGLRSLRRLEINNCNISDLTPLAEFTQLEWLELVNNLIADITPLRNLRGLEHLNLDANIIEDVSPLAQLTRLELLYLENNNISDVSPLTGLTKLERLDLRNNSVSDFSPLEGLPDETFVRMSGNPGFPSGGSKITGPWLWAIVPGTRLNENTDFLARATGGAATELKVAANGAKEGKAVGNSVWTLHRLSATGGNNINRMTDALGWGTGEEIYDHIVYGSVVLDAPEEQETTMLVGSSDAVKVWLNGELVHKAFVERGSGDYQDFYAVTLKQGKNVLLVALDNHGHGSFSGFFGFAPDAKYTVFQPGINFFFSSDTARYEVEETFTLHLNIENVSDLGGWQADIVFDPAVLRADKVNEGNFLKEDDEPPFFDAGTINNKTGRITGLKAVRISQDRRIGRQGILLTIEFTVIGSGESRLTLDNFEVGSRRGEMIPIITPEIVIVVEGDGPTKPAWDVNQDGQVNVLDLILVAQYLGGDAASNPRADVNGDGIINILDLIVVAQHFGESTEAAAPFSVSAIETLDLDPAIVQEWIAQARVENDGSLAHQQGIENLQRLLASLLPEETALLANYPNPFNPETWIPYHLAVPTDVTVHIYGAGGTLIRTLALGHQAVGVYESRTRAAYWDGKNEVGESVASGVYFYTLTAGNFTATRKMLIMK